ncbi:short-chain dehydrogenase/reductase SDR [Pediococcus damnosus]|uniref:Short-chain dehydrogenase/reductase SDR n=1 Tax=Pediococcus damnosus TaxID=51663 RepID=A0A143ASC7_9LACO|nr:SDR family NAD(P)-dependent oxidoreductase [Pediococcus damnosus]AMV60389.1 short-chain dehydrogenase/reductase SDR [Pediococcus damnosus]AMV63210.1 short-chain dehydrogenase/reductase SDR [Pediococcus damnosus]AMV64639.1 short-chain dehydrogenase/reductase SDR [Pediococcus damnosus]AMV66895.1 short-chain dehydrogenase/reductase SDR [Pediococcus damnosus]AMV69500.1 short-chain dehydrogenase/reductase SDR [Pediococcus damnosus]
MAEKEIITLITGANKGIGFATAEGLGKLGQHILVGARDAKRGQNAVEKLQAEGYKATFIQLDVTNKAQIQNAADEIKQKFGYLSVLVNNAGITLGHHTKASEMSTDEIRKIFDVNFFGLLDVTQAMVPLLKKGRPAKIVNVSSDMGSLGLATDPQSRFYRISSVGYQASKAAANFATIDFSKELSASDIIVNAVNPGATNTEFGGRPKGLKIPGMNSVEAGAAQIVKMASLPFDEKVTGTFTENVGTLPW